MPIAHYTTDPAASMEVLKRCAERLYELDANIELGRCIRDDDRTDDNIYFVTHDHTIQYAEATTLELAICLFTQQLFTPNPKQGMEK